MTIKEAYNMGYNSGWKRKYTGNPFSLIDNADLYISFEEGERDGYSDWKYECQSERD